VEKYIISIFLSYYPLKQGLKPTIINMNIRKKKIFILLSIKTRIETFLFLCLAYPCQYIFILLSIKTRIETSNEYVSKRFLAAFLSYYPLKQGLKHIIPAILIVVSKDFYPTIH